MAITTPSFSEQKSSTSPAYPQFSGQAGSLVDQTLAQGQSDLATKLANIDAYMATLRSLQARMMAQARGAASRGGGGNPQAQFRAGLEAAAQAGAPMESQIAQMLLAKNASFDSLNALQANLAGIKTQLASIQQSQSSGFSQSGGGDSRSSSTIGGRQSSAAGYPGAGTFTGMDGFTGGRYTAPGFIGLDSPQHRQDFSSAVKNAQFGGGTYWGGSSTFGYGASPIEGSQPFSAKPTSTGQMFGPINETSMGMEFGPTNEISTGEQFGPSSADFFAFLHDTISNPNYDPNAAALGVFAFGSDATPKSEVGIGYSPGSPFNPYPGTVQNPSSSAFGTSPNSDWQPTPFVMPSGGEAGFWPTVGNAAQLGAAALTAPSPLAEKVADYFGIETIPLDQFSYRGF